MIRSYKLVKLRKKYYQHKIINGKVAKYNQHVINKHKIFDNIFTLEKISLIFDLFLKCKISLSSI